jgi:hypothetical protein
MKNAHFNGHPPPTTPHAGAKLRQLGQAPVSLLLFISPLRQQ